MPGRGYGECKLPRRCRLMPAVALGAGALLAALALAADRAHAQGALGSDLLRPELDGDSRNPQRFDRSRPARSGEPAQFSTVPNFQYRPSIGAGTTGFVSAGAAPARVIRRGGRVVRVVRPGSAPSAPEAAGQTSARKAAVVQPIRVVPIEQPAPTLLLPESVTNRPVRRPVIPPPPGDTALVLAPAPAVPLRRVLPYEFNPYEAVGTSYGSFLFRPSVEVTRGYDTNPPRTMRTHGSWFELVAPQLLVNSLWSRHELTATLRGSYWNYDTFTRMSRPLVDTKVNGRYDVTSLARVEVEGRYYLGTDSPGSPNVQADLKWLPIYHQVGGTVGFGQRINRFDFIGRLGGDRTTYTDSHFEDGQVRSNADRNFERYFTVGRINYELSPGVIPFTEFNADTRVYDRYLDAGGEHRNSQGVSGKIGSSFLFPGSLTGEISAGYLRRRYDDYRLPSFGAYLVDASMIWMLNALTTARFTAVTSVAESRLIGVSGVLTREYTAQIDHAFRRWLIGTMRFSRGMDDYVGSPRLDLRYTAGAQLTYMMSRDWWVRAEYRNEWRESNIPGQNYSANVYQFGLRWQR
jgi:hypothetical protein